MYNFSKRLLDIVVSLLALIILTPVLLPVVIILDLVQKATFFIFKTG